MPCSKSAHTSLSSDLLAFTACPMLWEESEVRDRSISRQECCVPSLFLLEVQYFFMNAHFSISLLPSLPPSLLPKVHIPRTGPRPKSECKAGRVTAFETNAPGDLYHPVIWEPHPREFLNCFIVSDFPQNFGLKRYRSSQSVWTLLRFDAPGPCQFPCCC